MEKILPELTKVKILAKKGLGFATGLLKFLDDGHRAGSKFFFFLFFFYLNVFFYFI